MDASTIVFQSRKQVVSFLLWCLITLHNDDVQYKKSTINMVQDWIREVDQNFSRTS
jgi:hypothetical protein